MKVMLAYLCDYRDRDDYFLSLIPYGLSSMASYLQNNGVNVILANFSAQGHRRAAAVVRDMKPDVLGISIFSFNRSESLKLIAAVSKGDRGPVIVAGGPFASHFAAVLVQRYPRIGYVVQGEGEEAMLRIIQGLQNGDRPERILRAGRINDLDILPPASAFKGPLVGVDPHRQNSFIVTSRGCPGACTYCSSPSFWGRTVKYRSIKKIVEEIEDLYRRDGIIYFSIRDDNFTLKKQRVLDFCEELSRRKVYILWNCQARADTVDLEMLVAMKRAGLEHIQYGVESGSPRILDAMKKNLTPERFARVAEDTRKAGVVLSIYLMAGMPGEEDDDVDATIKLIRKMRPHDGIVSPVACYPGTELYDELAAAGDYPAEFWFTGDDDGPYARKDRKAARWTERLARELAREGVKNRYRPRDFMLHRSMAGDDCWVTDIMEGDFFAEKGDYPRAQALYRRVSGSYPENIWAYLRMGELALRREDEDDALASFHGAAEALPSYYGSWKELSMLYHRRRDRSLARKYAAMALERNPYDAEMAVLMKKLKSPVA